MKYNAKYDRWFSKEGLVYRYDKKLDKLVLCKLNKTWDGYLHFGRSIHCKTHLYFVHRAIWETFNGPITGEFEIDHDNTDRTDNRLSNLKLVTHKMNMRNPISVNKMSTDFGKKYFSHFGLHKMDNLKLYRTEYTWFKRHGHCRWEEE